MTEQTFSRRQVERSFRKFNDLVNDLFNAQFQTWSGVFSNLIKHCEEDEVMMVVTAPLKSNQNVDAKEWLEEAMGSVTGMLGSGSFSLPYDDDDRTALLYQFFLIAEKDDFDLSKFCVVIYGTRKYQDMARVFNQELVSKFTREVSYRLEEITQDFGNEQEIPKEAMLVFHHHDHSMNIHGNIEGSNIASGQSSVSDSSATHATTSNPAEVLEALRLARQSIVNLPDEEQKKAEVFSDAVEGEIVNGNYSSTNSLAYAAALLTLFEKAGAAVGALATIKTFFNL